MNDTNAAGSDDSSKQQERLRSKGDTDVSDKIPAESAAIDDSSQTPEPTTSPGGTSTIREGSVSVDAIEPGGRPDEAMTDTDGGTDKEEPTSNASPSLAEQSPKTDDQYKQQAQHESEKPYTYEPEDESDTETSSEFAQDGESDREEILYGNYSTEVPYESAVPEPSMVTFGVDDQRVRTERVDSFVESIETHGHLMLYGMEIETRTFASEVTQRLIGSREALRHAKEDYQLCLDFPCGTLKIVRADSCICSGDVLRLDLSVEQVCRAPSVDDIRQLADAVQQKQAKLLLVVLLRDAPEPEILRTPSDTLNVQLAPWLASIIDRHENVLVGEAGKEEAIREGFELLEEYLKRCNPKQRFELSTELRELAVETFEGSIEQWLERLRELISDSHQARYRRARDERVLAWTEQGWDAPVAKLLLGLLCLAGVRSEPTTRDVFEIGLRLARGLEQTRRFELREPIPTARSSRSSKSHEAVRIKEQYRDRHATEVWSTSFDQLLTRCGFRTKALFTQRGGQNHELVLEEGRLAGERSRAIVPDSLSDTLYLETRFAELHSHYVAELSRWLAELYAVTRLDDKRNYRGQLTELVSRMLLNAHLQDPGAMSFVYLFDHVLEKLEDVEQKAAINERALERLAHPAARLVHTFWKHARNHLNEGVEAELLKVARKRVLHAIGRSRLGVAALILPGSDPQFPVFSVIVDLVRDSTRGARGPSERLSRALPRGAKGEPADEIVRRAVNVLKSYMSEDVGYQRYYVEQLHVLLRGTEEPNPYLQLLFARIAYEAMLIDFRSKRRRSSQSLAEHYVVGEAESAKESLQALWEAHIYLAQDLTPDARNRGPYLEQLAMVLCWDYARHESSRPVALTERQVRDASIKALVSEKSSAMERTEKRYEELSAQITERRDRAGQLLSRNIEGHFRVYNSDHEDEGYFSLVRLVRSLAAAEWSFLVLASGDDQSEEREATIVGRFLDRLVDALGRLELKDLIDDWQTAANVLDEMRISFDSKSSARDSVTPWIREKRDRYRRLRAGVRRRMSAEQNALEEVRK